MAPSAIQRARTLLIAAASVLGGCSGAETVNPAPVDTTSPGSAGGAPAERTPTPKVMQLEPSDPVYSVVESADIYAPAPGACAEVEAVRTPLSEGAEMNVTVRRHRDGRVAVAGRTNLPDGVLLFGGLDGYGGWFDEHMRVRGGCFHGPWLSVPVGVYKLGLGISGMDDDVPPAALAMIGAGGVSLTGKHVRRIDGKREFEYRQVAIVGDEPAARAAERAYSAVPGRIVEEARRLIAAGRNMERYRIPRGTAELDVSLEAAKECGRLMRELRPQAERFGEPFKQYDSVIKPAVLGLRMELASCVSCSPEMSLNECKKAEQVLQQKAEWMQPDSIAEYRAQLGL